MKTVLYDPSGQKLWINIEMKGLYFISYVYQLWASDISQPPILTNPLKQGNNNIPHDDYHPVVNDYNPNEPLTAFRKRVIDVRFWIIKGPDDNGYDIRVNVHQGNDFHAAPIIGVEGEQGNLGGQGLKEVFVTIELDHQ